MLAFPQRGDNAFDQALRFRRTRWPDSPLMANIATDSAGVS